MRAYAAKKRAFQACLMGSIGKIREEQAGGAALSSNGRSKMR
jgi:hypothetical protein